MNSSQPFRKALKYLAVALAGVLVIVGVWFGTSNYEKLKPIETSSEDTKTPEQTDASESKQETTDSKSEETEPSEATVSEEDLMNIDRLIDRYYSAKINDDAEELNKIVESDVPYDVESLENENKFIEKYDNFRTYTIPGLTDNYYIVYVKYDIYFYGITVGAPSLNHFIVAKQDAEHYYIYDKPVSQEFKTYVEETEKSELVLGLRQEVEEALEEACKKNTDLNYLIQLLNGQEPESSKAESTTAEDTQDTQDTQNETAESDEPSSDNAETTSGEEGE